MNNENKETVEKKPACELARAMRLGDGDAGKGACFAGSGNEEFCEDGNVASSRDLGNDAYF